MLNSCSFLSLSSLLVPLAVCLQVRILYLCVWTRLEEDKKRKGQEGERESEENDRSPVRHHLSIAWTLLPTVGTVKVKIAIIDGPVTVFELPSRLQTRAPTGNLEVIPSQPSSLSNHSHNCHESFPLFDQMKIFTQNSVSTFACKHNLE